MVLVEPTIVSLAGTDAIEDHLTNSAQCLQPDALIERGAYHIAEM